MEEAATIRLFTHQTKRKKMKGLLKSLSRPESRHFQDVSLDIMEHFVFRRAFPISPTHIKSAGRFAEFNVVT